MALTDCIYYWKCDEASGARIATLGGNNLSVYNSASYIDTSSEGRLGRCADWYGQWSPSWDNTGICLSTASAIPISTFIGPWTINLWIHTGKVWGTWGYEILSHWNVYGTDTGTVSTNFGSGSGNGTVYFKTCGADGAYHNLGSSAPCLLSRWHMLTFTYDNSNKAKNIYINGINRGSATASHTNNLGTGGNEYLSTSRIGSPGAAYGGYRGSVKYQHISIFPTAKTQVDIDILYNNSAGLAYPFFDGKALQMRS